MAVLLFYTISGGRSYNISGLVGRLTILRGLIGLLPLVRLLVRSLTLVWRRIGLSVWLLVVRLVVQGLISLRVLQRNSKLNYSVEFGHPTSIKGKRDDYITILSEEMLNDSELR